MQYEGLSREDSPVLPVETVELTNCFASTFALLEDFEVLGYNIDTFSAEPGTLKIFDVLAMDPAHILMDTTVEWEMCNGAGILAQFKNMFGGDYAAIADNLTRELMVIFIESPEDRKTIKQIYEAGKCAKDVADEAGLIEDQDQEGTDTIDDETDPEFWNGFNKEVDPADAAKKAAECTDNVDRYKAGKIMGRLSAKFFAQELKANI